MIRYFDTHAHYNDEVFNENREEILNKCRKNNVDYIINVGASLQDSVDSVELAKKYDYIYSAIGIHPQYAKMYTANQVYDLFSSKNKEKVVAIGEIGLDYHYTKEEKVEQRKLFIEQIELANTLKLPVLIHTRDASLDTYNILKDEKRPEYGTLLHCFNPTDDLVRLVLERGYTVAFGGNITYKRSGSFEEYLNKIPLGQIVIETDAPYLAPVPVRGTVNDSSNLKYICEKLARLKKLDTEYVANEVFNNSINFYNIKK